MLRRRKVEAFDAEAAGTAELDPEGRAARLADPFSRLEHEDEDKLRARQMHQQISTLRQDAEDKHRCTFGHANTAMRGYYRGGTWLSWVGWVG
jgi:hypothetical protein